MRDEPLALGRDKLVFFDWNHVEAGTGVQKSSKEPNMVPNGVRLRGFRPAVPREPSLKVDRPWETGFLGSYYSVVQDTDDPNLVGLWYEFFPSHDTRDLESIFCYAESKDCGQTWEKPNLGLVEWEGSKDNNILLTPEEHFNGTAIHGPFVFLDGNPGCPPGERYKLTYCSADRPRGEGRPYGGTSPDGIHWNLFREPIADSWADTQMGAWWEPRKGKYVGFFRLWSGKRRQVGYSETTDFSNWPDPVPILGTEPTMGPDEDWYVSGARSWPGAGDSYVMLSTIYRRTRDDLFTELRGSRDLRHWFPVPPTPLLDPEELGGHFYGGFYVGQGIVRRGGKWLVPLGVPEVTHNEGRLPGTRLGKMHMLSWREDGFTGIEAPGTGEFWTRPLQVDGNELAVNAITKPHGLVKVGIVDDFTRMELPGRGLDECDPISGDELWSSLSWGGERDLSEFDDCVVRLHFVLRRAVLHAARWGGTGDG
ncbi:MAG: hypothetical protein ACTSU5_08100 [Promethearchaeota archaeon]